MLQSLLLAVALAGGATEVEFDSVLITADRPTPAMALITERRVDTLDVCAQLASKDVFYVEARFHAARETPPTASLRYDDDRVYYLSCILNSQSGMWLPFVLSSKSVEDHWYLMDEPRTYCACAPDTTTGAPSGGPFDFLSGTCEVTNECFDARTFVYRAEYGDSGLAVLVPHDPAVEKLAAEFVQHGVRPFYCPEQQLRDFNRRRGEQYLCDGYVASDGDFEWCVGETIRYTPPPPCSTALPPVEVVAVEDGLMLFKTYGASYYERPDAPHFYGVAWIPSYLDNERPGISQPDDTRRRRRRRRAGEAE